MSQQTLKTTVSNTKKLKIEVKSQSDFLDITRIDSRYSSTLQTVDERSGIDK